MESTLLVGDRLFVSKYSYGISRHSFPFSPKLFDGRFLFKSPKRGDVVVFKTPSEISSSAVSTNPDSMAMETLTLFCRIFGSVTGSIALTTGCLGGIYITSDLVRNFLDFFLKSDFLKSFEDKGRLDYYMRDIPIFISKKANMGLIGSTYHINNQWIQKGFKV